MARESIQKKLQRVRPPRVQVSYEVQVGDAIEMKELPFVLGVMGDFTGMPSEPLPKLRDRRFVEVTPDNFDKVLEKMKPHLSFAVENKLSEESDSPQLKVDLQFENLDDFSPDQVAAKVKPLQQLLELRRNLQDLSGTLQTNDALDQLLLEAVKNTDKRDQLRAELGIGNRPGQPATTEVGNE
jgi:type VI secretion system protein ImpB